MKKIFFGLFLILFVLILIAVVQNPRTPAPPSLTISPSVTVTATASAAVNETVLGQTTKTTGCTAVNGNPDSACTPGETDARVTQENIHSTICVSGYSASVRPPVSVTNKIKKERMLAYGDTDSMANYELDHLVSLELGGCPDCVANLWPESYTITLNAREKDKVENYLHAQVCNGSIPLTTAQEEIAHDWESVYNRLPIK